MGIFNEVKSTFYMVSDTFTMLASGNAGAEALGFQRILFLDFFSINPMPSNTFVMSYIRLFCTFSTSAA